ncbi:DUF2336 domain-containing protein, partial [Bradyrhizobium jicamae]|uniref:DUF2336 domain-containing protein n=1 Tax=Bradyrhizobium jicamae TaxID=280332 RepID=UPI001FD8C188
MTVSPSPIPELDDIVSRGDPRRRADAMRRISELFLQGAASFRSDHVDLFDGVLTSLVPHAEIEARAELAERLSTLANAPRGLVGQLAHEDEIAIAGPLLRHSPVIDEKMLLEIASMKGQGHLLAMAERPSLSADLTDVMIARGDRAVVRRAAGNAGAAFSSDGYSTLIKRAGQDGVLTIKLGQRDDLSSGQLKELLSGSIDVIRRRLFQVVKPERQADIKQAMVAITAPTEREERRDFAPAQRTVLKLHREGMLGEGALLNFARAFKYEESIAALSAITGVKIE